MTTTDWPESLPTKTLSVGPVLTDNTGVPLLMELAVRASRAGVLWDDTGEGGSGDLIELFTAPETTDGAPPVELLLELPATNIPGYYTLDEEEPITAGGRKHAFTYRGVVIYRDGQGDVVAAGTFGPFGIDVDGPDVVVIDLGRVGAITFHPGSGDNDPPNPANHGGVPAGGTTGQVLAKASGADYAVHWATLADGAGEVFPDGSAAGQVLTWDGDGVTWALPEIPDPAEVLPDDGDLGDVLTLGEDGPEWAPPASGGGSGVPAGGLTGQVLAKASDTDGDATWTDVEAVAFTAPVTEAGTSFTIGAGHGGKTVRCTAGGEVTVTIPNQGSYNAPLGYWTKLYAEGAEGITINGASVTLVADPYLSAAQNTVIVLEKVAANTWAVIGGQS